MLLKHITPQNIVVGRRRERHPPLVGWAAVTNDLSLLALYLFAIILLWTPPHAWALMLLIEKDYAKAKMPMMPVAWGNDEARWQSLLYSILLFFITLIPYTVGLTGVALLRRSPSRWRCAFSTSRICSGAAPTKPPPSASTNPPTITSRCSSSPW